MNIVYSILSPPLKGEDRGEGCGHTPPSPTLAIFLLLALTPLILWAGPFAPAAGVPGSTAIHLSTNLFVAWATGWTNYVPGIDEADDMGFSPDWQHPAKALGRAQGTSFDVVSLGGGGSITMTFAVPIADGPGYDFAVFENSFNSNFLELAWVEVSSDGENFVRLKNRSMTAHPVPFLNGSVDPTDLDGLAGKYRQGYGTPFDLGELQGEDALVNIDAVRFVRLIDIMGDGLARDSENAIVYDPYPTTDSPGFDLDAVGVIHYAIGAQLSPTPAGLHFSWQTVSGQVYRIESAGHLNDPWTDSGLSFTGNNETVTQTIDHPAPACRFYRILRYPEGSEP